jgi:predicted MPP superfamily phosphohydrolase
VRRRLVVFFLLFPSLTSPTYAYLGWRLCSRPAEWLLLALPYAAVLSFPVLVSRRSAARTSSWLERSLTRAAYVGMGVVSFLLVVSLLRDALGLAAHRWLAPVDVVELAAGLMVVGSLRGFFGPAVRRVPLAFESLPPALRGLRIAQISDLHLSSHIGHRYAARTVRRLLREQPDLIALTGDIGDGNVAELGAEIETLRPLAKVAPAFYVPGNHEVYWNLGEWLEQFRALGLRVLLNRGDTLSVRGERVFVGGITDPMCATAGMPPDLAAASRGADAAGLKILLSHRPDPAEDAAKAGFDLQLSGHTHGGQFFPWTLVAHAVHRYSLGLYRIGKMFVYVSAGTGSWGPRIRLGTRAEITIFTLG